VRRGFSHGHSGRIDHTNTIDEPVEVGEFVVQVVEESHELLLDFGGAKRPGRDVAVANIGQLAAERVSLRTDLTAAALNVLRNHAQA
jgi:hypothetical protein